MCFLIRSHFFLMLLLLVQFTIYSMVYHVGLQLDTGVAVAYTNKKKISFNLKPASTDFLSNFCESLDDIKKECDEELGNVYIDLLPKNDNEFRKKIIGTCFSKGFLKVEIIDSLAANYLGAISQTDYIPQNDETVWKINGDNCEVWQIINQKAHLNESLSAEYSNGIYKKIIEKQKFNLLPDVILMDSKNNLNMDTAIFKCKIYFYHSNILETGALIKARKAAGDPILAGIDVCNLLDRTITVKMNDKIISIFKANESLPLKRSIKVENVEKISSLEIHEAEIFTNITPPKYKSFLIIINIDINGIYDISFKNVPLNPSISVDNYIEAVYYETQNPATINDHTLINKFKFPETSNTENAIGIHCGNWQTSAALWHNNEIKDIALGDNGEEIIASYVQIDDENIKCGNIDFNGLQYPSSSVYDIKTFIGKYLTEIIIDENWLFKIVDFQHGDSFVEEMQEKLGIKFNVGIQIEDSCGTVVKYPEEIFAYLLKHIKVKAEYKGQKLADAIITVPGIYSHSQKTTTRIAALLAGWQNIFLMPESIATMFANFINFFDSAAKNSMPNILIDLGHACMQICIFKIENNKIHILYNSSDPEIGGRKYDNLLFKYFQKQVKAEFGIDVSKNLWSKFIFYCKDIKHVLSFRDSYKLYIEDFDPSKEGYIDITRKHFEKLADNLLDKTQDFINATLKESGFKAAQIETILQTGGGCRMPMIKLLLRQTFPKAKNYANDYPLNTVAVGAVRYASTIKKALPPESSGTNSAKEKVMPENPEINAVGIDLGTTRCCVAVNRATGIETIGLENEGNRLMPSYVGYDERHEKFGQIVINRMRDHSKSTAFDAKRLLGKEINEIKIDENWTFTVISYGNKVKLQLRTYEGEALKYPEEISTALLKHFKEKTEQFQTKKLSEVVITIPTAFNDKQKKSTYVAAILAGWKKVHLISETVAAALAYSIYHPSSAPQDSPAILVFDLGGGTLDVGVFKYKNDTVDIIGRSGDPHLGGRDFDKILVTYFTQKLRDDFDITVPESKKYFLLSKCQEIKENLSILLEDSLDVDDIDFTKDGSIKITRTEFELMAVNLLAKSKEVIFQTIKNAEYSIDKIEKVIQVGGGCRMPMIKQLIRETFPKAEHCCVTNPDEIIAVGAAHYSYNLNTKNY